MHRILGNDDGIIILVKDDFCFVALPRELKGLRRFGRDRDEVLVGEVGVRGDVRLWAIGHAFFEGFGQSFGLGAGD